MEKEKTITDFINERNYDKAADLFNQAPVYNYNCNNPLFNYKYFEFASTPNKNPIFLRILLSYISLINAIYSVVNNDAIEFHEALLKFNAKFSYIKINEFVKIVLLIKSNI